MSTESSAKIWGALHWMEVNQTYQWNGLRMAGPSTADPRGEWATQAKRHGPEILLAALKNKKHLYIVYSLCLSLYVKYTVQHLWQ